MATLCSASFLSPLNHPPSYLSPTPSTSPRYHLFYSFSSTHPPTPKFEISKSFSIFRIRVLTVWLKEFLIFPRFEITNLFNFLNHSFEFFVLRTYIHVFSFLPTFRTKVLTIWFKSSQIFEIVKLFGWWDLGFRMSLWVMDGKSEAFAW